MEGCLMNSEVFMDRLYAKQVDLAKAIVKNLRDLGVPSYLFGGLAVDMLLKERENHKDIDIFVYGYGDEIEARVHKALNSMRLRLVGEEYIGYNMLWKEVWVYEDDEHMIPVDLFYGMFGDGHVLLYPINYSPDDPVILDVPLIIYTEMIGISALRKSDRKRAMLKWERLKRLLANFGVPEKYNP